jgi:transposase-like protein
MVIVIRRKRYWLWRAVDNEGEVLDFLVQSRRGAKAARKLMRKLLKKQGFAPSRVVTDKLRSYPSAFRAIGLAAEHDRSLRANNRAENSHQPVRRRERKLQRFNLSSSCRAACRGGPLASTPRPPLRPGSRSRLSPQGDGKGRGLWIPLQRLPCGHREAR